MVEKVLNNKWLKIGLLAVAGLVLAGGLVFAGMQIGKQQAIRDTQYATRTTPALIPTQVPVATSTSTFQLETTLSPAETANWKTYEDEAYKYSIKYPPNWEVSHRYVNVSVSFNTSNFLFDLVNIYVDGWTGWGDARNKAKNILVAGIPAYQEVSNEFPRQDFTFTRTYFEKDGHVFAFECVNTIDVEIEKTCNQVLSTFRFLE